MIKAVQNLPSELWTRIEAFNIDGDDNVAFPFDVRLAQENGWSRDFARRVVDEYKRFVFLAMTAGHPVTPSDQVDQAWHLHLTYTRSYWQRLCGEVLPRPLHHDPTKGGDAEEHKFDDWYARTKESYLRAFGAPPPTDIWPRADVRFGDDLHQKRINTQRNYVIPKRVVKVSLRVGALACGASVLFAGCAPLVLATGVRDPVVAAIVIGVLLVAVLLVCIMAARRRTTNRSSSDGGCGGGFFFGGGCGGGHSGKHADSHGNDADGSSDSGGGCGGGGCGGGGD